VKRFPIRLHQGETSQFTLYFWDVTYDENGVEITREFTDLTAATITVTHRPKGGGTLMFTKDSGNPAHVEILDQTNLVDGKGRAVLKYISTDTDATAPGEYEFDAWADLADGRKKPSIDTSPFIVVRSTRTPP
jgi:hypothetical protein